MKRLSIMNCWRMFRNRLSILEMRSLALQLIVIYQQRISPRKGFSCAYRAITGRKSCSAYAARCIEKRGVIAGTRLALRRMRRCAAVHAQRVPTIRRRTHTWRPQGQLGHCDLPLDSCPTPDVSDVAACACEGCDGYGGPCDLWTSKRKRDRRAVQ
jgi:putative component of membrane protein insertase Oxa1/YidC/SpoIIIJ protein YidD